MSSRLPQPTSKVPFDLPFGPEPAASPSGYQEPRDTLEKEGGVCSDSPVL